jgi:hypothetical protein
MAHWFKNWKGEDTHKELTFILRKERRVFENKVLRKIFRPKRQEVTGQKKLHNGGFVSCYLHQVLLG